MDHPFNEIPQTIKAILEQHHPKPTNARKNTAHTKQDTDTYSEAYKKAQTKLPRPPILYKCGTVVVFVFRSSEDGRLEVKTETRAVEVIKAFLAAHPQLSKPIVTCTWPLIGIKGYWLLLSDLSFTRNRSLHHFFKTVPDGTRVVFMANGIIGLLQNELSYRRVLDLFPRLQTSFCWALEKNNPHALRFDREWFWIPGPVMQELIQFPQRLGSGREHEINLMELQDMQER